VASVADPLTTEAADVQTRLRSGSDNAVQQPFHKLNPFYGLVYVNEVLRSMLLGNDARLLSACFYLVKRIPQQLSGWLTAVAKVGDRFGLNGSLYGFSVLPSLGTVADLCGVFGVLEGSG
jgi:hypothetical protein